MLPRGWLQTRLFHHLNTSQNSNNLKAPLGELASNTRLDIPNTTPTTTNKSSVPTASNELQNNNFIDKSLCVFHNHLDWLSFTFEKLSKEEFNQLIQLTGRGLTTLEKNKSWSSGERARSYQNTIHSAISLKGAYNCYQVENKIRKVGFR